MTSPNVTNIAQTGGVGKNLLAMAFPVSQSELVEPIVSPEESSSDAGIGGCASWTKKKWSSATLEKIWTQSERKQARSAQEGAIEN